jgi:hypothetical protein
VLLPCLTRIRWMLGVHRRLDRLCEKVTCFPNHGFFPQTSQMLDMVQRLSWKDGPGERGRGRRQDSRRLPRSGIDRPGWAGEGEVQFTRILAAPDASEVARAWA